METRGAGIIDREGMVPMMRKATKEETGIDRGGTGERMMAGTRNIVHNGQRMAMREATDTAHVRRGVKKDVEVIIAEPGAMPPTKTTTTAGGKMTDRDVTARKKRPAHHDVTIQDRTSVVVAVTETAVV